MAVVEETLDCTVGEIAAPIRNALVGGPFGSDLGTADYVPTGVPVIRGQNLSVEKYVGGEFVYVSDAKATKLTSNLARPGDLVFTQRGNAVLHGGQVAIVPKVPFDRYVVSQSQMKLSPDPTKVDWEFLYLVFSSGDYRHYLRSNAIVTGVPHINLGLLRSYPLSLPPLAEQKAIAAILGALDDKIELNKRMNATLETMARALFRSWFVDFGPVRVKLDGRQPAGLPSATAALFPDSFQDSRLGHIPMGWSFGRITAYCERIHSGGTPRRDEPQYWSEGTIPWLTSGEVRQPMITATESFITDIGLKESSAKWVPANSTVVALYGATAGQVSFLGTTATTNQAICSLIPKPQFEFFNYFAMRNATVEMEKKAVGSAQQNISKGIIEETVVVLPPPKVLTQFNLAAAPLFGTWIANINQSRTLATLRDALLPRLLSGELSIPAALAASKETLV